MTRRPSQLLISVVASLSLLAGCSHPASTPKKSVAIFNLLSHPILDASVQGIKDGLAANGYGPDAIDITEVNANGEMDKLDAFTRELLARRPDVIVPVSTPVTQAVVKIAPPGQNIVFSTVTNPADAGMDRHPQNETGVSDAVNYKANIELIRELLPAARRIGIIYNAGERNSQFGIDQVKAVVAGMELPGGGHFALDLVTVASANDVAAAAASLVRRVDVFYVGSDNTVVGALPALLKAAVEAKKPVIASDSGSVDQGALAAVSVDYQKLGRKTGDLVAQVLKTGAPAGDIPNVVFTGDSLILNAKAASRIGFTFPDAIRARAAKIVDR